MIAMSERASASAAPLRIRGPRPPVCVVVTGPRGAGKTRWLQECIRRVIAGRPAARCAVLLAEEGRTRMESFCAGTPGMILEKLHLPCLCCPEAADLPKAVESLIAKGGAGWLFLELPVMAAPGLLAEFDRQLGCARAVILRLTPAWAKMLQSGMLSPFQSGMLGVADAVITNDDEAGRATGLILSRGSSASCSSCT
jgi:hypothetical protein